VFDGERDVVGLTDYLAILRKRWLIVLVTTLLGVGVAVTLVRTSTKVYTASAQIFVAASSQDNTAALNNGNTFAQARVQSYTSVANSPAVTDAVVKQLGLAMTAGQLASKISADAPLNKVLLNIHVTDDSPVQAARLTNAVASQFVVYVQSIERLSAGSDASPVALTIIHPAQVPALPTSPKVKLDLVLGFVAGLALGLGLAVLRETLDTRVRTAADIGQCVHAPILGVVPSDKRTTANPVAFRANDRSPRSEAIRQLRTNLQYINVDSPPKLIVVTSAVSGEGKSTVAVNLASALAEVDFRVCLLDADLRRPRVASYLDLVGGAGLTSILAGKASIVDVIQPVGLNLTVITSGPIPPNPAELLASAHFRSILRDLAAQNDYVVIDSAPLLPVADGSQVASAADVALLVVQAKRTNREQLRRASESLERVGASLGGVVFNMVSQRDSGNYYEYYASDRPTKRAART
jgi:capsular exopolysaccharide synthesis family protein